ncbi:MAG TPA: DNA polymerase III subunit delta, partial [Vicinamibacterales bacterium]|nr:DNA polymerase III subunit delta [Vicinamibacterales bacterium]
MATAAPSAVRKQIAAGATDPIYLLVGEDDVEKAALAAEFAELVDEGLRAFNVERIHAGDWTTGDKLIAGVDAVVAAARTLPMMAPRRIVTITQVEAIISPKRDSEDAEKAQEALAALLERPEREATLVFVATAVDQRKKLARAFQKHATIVPCGSIEDMADAERWIRTRVAAAGVEIEPAAARMLAQRSGLDLKRLRGDLDRLLLYALGQKRIGVADVHEISGPAAALVEDWGMANAIEASNAAEALRQLGALLDAGSAPEMILGQLGWLVRSKFPQIAPRHVRTSVDALFRTDLDLKRSAGDPRILLERLVVELCARGAPQRTGGTRGL